MKRKFIYLAVCDTMWLFANGDTFGTVEHFTTFIRTFNLIIKSYYTSHSGFSHFTSQIAFLGSAQLVWHFGGSQTGSQIAGQ